MPLPDSSRMANQRRIFCSCWGILDSSELAIALDALRRRSHLGRRSVSEVRDRSHSHPQCIRTADARYWGARSQGADRRCRRASLLCAVSPFSLNLVRLRAPTRPGVSGRMSATSGRPRANDPTAINAAIRQHALSLRVLRLEFAAFGDIRTIRSLAGPEMQGGRSDSAQLIMTTHRTNGCRASPDPLPPNHVGSEIEMFGGKGAITNGCWIAAASAWQNRRQGRPEIRRAAQRQISDGREVEATLLARILRSRSGQVWPYYQGARCAARDIYQYSQVPSDKHLSQAWREEPGRGFERLRPTTRTIE
jgi:hypothetical protein